MAKNKVVFVDRETGKKYWITKKGKVFPTNWKLQPGFDAKILKKADEYVKKKEENNEA